MKPILFNTEMVQAILDGHKTVTRRVMKPQPNASLTTGENALELLVSACAPYKPGQTLYVRETWAELETVYGVPYYAYKADDDILHHSSRENFTHWRPSLHMPREATRIFLRVTSVSVEPLQWCGNVEAKEEGCTCCSQFVRLWDSTIKPIDRALYGWEANPWVFVISFGRISKDEALQ